MSEPIAQALSERVARQEERMNTHQAKYESALNRMQADLAKRDSVRDAGIAKSEAYMSEHRSTLDKIRADMARRDAELAKRDAEIMKRDAERDAEFAKRDAEIMKRDAERDAEMVKFIAEREAIFDRRDKDNLRWQFGMLVSAVIVIIAVLGVLIRWPL